MKGDSPLFCVPSEKFAQFLDQELKILGLNCKERADFITFWMHVVRGKKFVLMRFIDKDVIDHVAPLSVVALGVGVSRSRVIMTFATSDSEPTSPWTSTPLPLPSVHDGSKRDTTKLVVVEWGAIFAGHL
eukprot:TRINITY_DN7122_c0_g1_i2.p2 TRINITY_DN7122_c0_g1~~TRINITY_DN7122_c0_g1_i2.p2  ORF type:complete len:130 (-),score=42.88 TRINITY_DN7122_c0_g1_i2:41-430(-)